MIPHSAPWITESDRHAVAELLRTGMIARGQRVEAFEMAVAGKVGASRTLATASGTDAIVAALEWLKVGPGDEVVMPTYVCCSVLFSVRKVGATPIFADSGEDCTLTADSVDAVMTPATRAIIAVHTFGHLCDLTLLARLGVPIIEDACQAFVPASGSGWAGTAGTVGIYSFHATKCLTTGEGGMLVWPKAAPAPEARPSAPPMSDMQAALGAAQLERYDEFLQRRSVLRERYDEAVRDRPELTAHLPGADTILFRYTLRSPLGFDHARSFFEARGVTVRRGVDDLLHRQEGLADDGFETSVGLFDRTVSLPFYPALGEEEADRVANAAREFARVH